VDVSLAHGERLANLIFYRMSEDADPDKVQQTVYQRQTLTLSKFFAKWPRTGVSNDREGE
jgi:deoxycytidine triphosphate deaminase